jgi:hypothetical protein
MFVFIISELGVLKLNTFNLKELRYVGYKLNKVEVRAPYSEGLPVLGKQPPI